MTDSTKSAERDEAIRALASKFSEVAGGQPLDISIAAATLFMVAQTDAAGSEAFEDYLLKKLRSVIALYTPTELRETSDTAFLGGRTETERTFNPHAR